ncbi:MAG: hypothetical protein ACJ8MH_03315 [Povalibacter sp.]|jgi:hypothetical protein
MSARREATFWLVAIATAVLYGFMQSGRFWVPLSSGSGSHVRTVGLLLHVVMSAYGWLPTFLAGLVVRRRPIVLAVLAVLLGGLSELFFRDHFAPSIFIDDWNPPIVKLATQVTAVSAAAVSAIAGQCLGKRSISKNRALTA